MLCAIWYHLCNLKYLKNTHGGVFLLVKLQTLACNFTKSNTPSWVFFTFFKLNGWYQIAQCIIYRKQSIYFHCKPLDWFPYEWNVEIKYAKSVHSNCWYPDTLESCLQEQASDLIFFSSYSANILRVYLGLYQISMKELFWK